MLLIYFQQICQGHIPAKSLRSPCFQSLFKDVDTDLTPAFLFIYPNLPSRPARTRLASRSNINQATPSIMQSLEQDDHTYYQSNSARCFKPSTLGSECKNRCRLL